MTQTTRSDPPSSPQDAAADRPPPLPDPEEERRRDAPGRPPRKKLSDLLTEIAADTSREVISIADLMRLLEGRARAALILVFAFPNALPAIPGTSGILGLPLLYLTFQMMLGRLPWLPRIIADRGLPRDRFAALIDRLVPYLSRTERLLRPRWRWLTSPGAERLLGIVCFGLAIVLTLPVPLGNMLPAFAICLIALGLLERDGLWVILGLLAAVVAFLISAGVVYVIVRGVLYVILRAFGMGAGPVAVVP
jgi:hypothetical protein